MSQPPFPPENPNGGPFQPGSPNGRPLPPQGTPPTAGPYPGPGMGRVLGPAHHDLRGCRPSKFRPAAYESAPLDMLTGS